jgi:hypothetical protein
VKLMFLDLSKALALSQYLQLLRVIIVYMVSPHAKIIEPF